MYIIFDFNGTIINDLPLSLRAINHCVDKYLDRKHLTVEEYRKIFTFPVKDYYEKVGFDFSKENWEEVGRYWMDYYLLHRKEIKLFPDVKQFIEKCHGLGHKCIILSASKIDNLRQHLEELELLAYFDEVLGIDNIYASSKLPIGLNFIKDKDKKDCLMIGDTLHDYEVSNQMGVRCILVARGHQDYETLIKECDNVCNNLNEVEICV